MSYQQWDRLPHPVPLPGWGHYLSPRQGPLPLPYTARTWRAASCMVGATLAVALGWRGVFTYPYAYGQPGSLTHRKTGYTLVTYRSTHHSGAEESMSPRAAESRRRDYVRDTRHTGRGSNNHRRPVLPGEPYRAPRLSRAAA